MRARLCRAGFYQLLLSWLCVFTLSACPAPYLAAPADALIDAEAVVSLLEAYLYTQPEHGVFEARASQYSDSGALKGKLLLMASRQGGFRIMGLSPTDDMLSVLASTEGRFTSYQRGDETCYVGRACETNVARFVSVPLDPSELVGVLFGRPALIPHDGVEMRWDAEVGAYLLEVEGGGQGLLRARGKRQKLWIEHGTGRVLQAILEAGDGERVQVRYSKFREIAGTAIPTQLDFDMTRDKTDLRLVYQTIDLEEPLTGDAFRFECPAGTQLWELPCDQGNPRP